MGTGGDHLTNATSLQVASVVDSGGRVEVQLSIGSIEFTNGGIAPFSYNQCVFQEILMSWVGSHEFGCISFPIHQSTNLSIWSKNSKRKVYFRYIVSVFLRLRQTNK